MIPGKFGRPIRISCSDPSYRSMRDVTGGIRANPRTSERGGGANISKSVKSLRGVRVGTLCESHISHARGGDLGLVVRSHDEDVMCLRGGEYNTPRAQRRVVHIEDIKEMKQY